MNVERTYFTYVARGVWLVLLRRGAMRPHLIFEGKIFEACQ